MEQEEEFTYCYGSLESRESDSRCGFALFFRDCLLSALCMYMYGLIFIQQQVLFLNQPRAAANAGLQLNMCVCNTRHTSGFIHTQW